MRAFAGHAQKRGGKRAGDFAAVRGTPFGAGPDSAVCFETGHRLGVRPKGGGGERGDVLECSFVTNTSSITYVVSLVSETSVTCDRATELFIKCVSIFSREKVVAILRQQPRPFSVGRAHRAARPAHTTNDARVFQRGA